MSEEQKKKISDTLKEKYNKNEIIKNLEGLKNGRGINKKKVAQYSLNSEFIANFESLTSAAKAIGGHFSVIGKVCDENKPHYKTYKGFIWKFIE